MQANLQFLKKIKPKQIWIYISQACLGLFVFCFSFQIRTLIHSSPIYYSGNFNPYTSFFLYLNDILIVISLIAFGLHQLINKKNNLESKSTKITITLLVATLFISIQTLIFSQSPLLSHLYTFRIISFLIFIYLTFQRIISAKTLINIFLASIVTQSMIAIFQYTAQSSIGLSFFGESTISPTTPGVAKIALSDHNILRSYGTLTHPNILGGALVFGLILSIKRFKSDTWFYSLILLIQTAALIMTFSRSAWLALIVAAFVWYSLQENKIRISFKWIALALSLTLFIIIGFNIEEIIFQRLLSPSPEAYTERSLFYSISKNMFLDQPWGVGIGQFTAAMQSYTSTALAPWQYQPVHNVFLLITNELGFIGIGIFLITLTIIFLETLKAKNEDSHLLISISGSIVTIMMFDHYFFTSYAGRFLIATFVFLSLNNLEQNPQPS